MRCCISGLQIATGLAILCVGSPALAHNCSSLSDCGNVATSIAGVIGIIILLAGLTILFPQIMSLILGTGAAISVVDTVRGIDSEPPEPNDPTALQEGASLAVGFTPLGTPADVYIAVTGEDFITGEKVPLFWRIIGVVPWVSELRKGVRLGGKAAEAAMRASRAVENSAENVVSSALRHEGKEIGSGAAEAASNIWNARRILAETRPDLTQGERNSIIKAFELQSFRVEALSARSTEFRYFDGVNAGLSGRWSTSQWIAGPADRIGRLALPENLATRAATVKFETGAVVFKGGVAPQLRKGPNLTGGGIQTYFATGPRPTFKELP